MSRGQKRWIERSNCRTDKERCTSKWVGVKFNRWIQAWEIIRGRYHWTPISYMDDLVPNLSKKQYAAGVGSSTRRRFVRRMLYAFRTAKLVDIRPWPPQIGVMTEFKRRVR